MVGDEYIVRSGIGNWHFALSIKKGRIPFEEGIAALVLGAQKLGFEAPN